MPRRVHKWIVYSYTHSCVCDNRGFKQGTFVECSECHRCFHKLCLSQSCLPTDEHMDAWVCGFCGRPSISMENIDFQMNNESENGIIIISSDQAMNFLNINDFTITPSMHVSMVGLHICSYANAEMKVLKGSIDPFNWSICAAPFETMPLEYRAQLAKIVSLQQQNGTFGAFTLQSFTFLRTVDNIDLTSDLAGSANMGYFFTVIYLGANCGSSIPCRINFASKTSDTDAVVSRGSVLFKDIGASIAIISPTMEFFIAGGPNCTHELVLLGWKKKNGTPDEMVVSNDDSTADGFSFDPTDAFSVNDEALLAFEYFSTVTLIGMHAILSGDHSSAVGTSSDHFSSEIFNKYRSFIDGELSEIFAPDLVLDWIQSEQKTSKYVPPLVAMAPHERFILTKLVHLRKVDGSSLNMIEMLVISWLDGNYDIR